MEPHSVPRTFYFSSRRKPQNDVPIFAGGIATTAAVVSSISLSESAISQKFKINEARKQLQGPLSFLSRSNNLPSFSATAFPPSLSVPKAASAGLEGSTRTFKFTVPQAASADPEGSIRTFKFAATQPSASNILSNEDKSTAAAFCMPKEAFVRELSSCSNNACRDSACKPSKPREFSQDTDDEEYSCNSRQQSVDDRDTSSVEDLQDAFSDIEEDDPEGKEQVLNNKRHKRGGSKLVKKKEDRQRWDADGLKNFAYGKS